MSNTNAVIIAHLYEAMQATVLAEIQSRQGWVPGLEIKNHLGLDLPGDINGGHYGYIWATILCSLVQKGLVERSEGGRGNVVYVRAIEETP